MAIDAERGAGVDCAAEIEVRPVTDEEVETLWEQGWVLLPELVSRERAAQLLAEAKAMMGAEGEALVGEQSKISGVGWFQDYSRPSDDNELLARLIRNPVIGHNAARMLGRDTAMRCFDDTLAVKLPISRVAQRGQATGFHQDQGFVPYDRQSVNYWMALDDVTPDQGPLQFYTGSQRLGLLGSADTLFEYPRLRACELSAPNRLRPGDATVHLSGCVHGAGENVSDRPRWAYIFAIVPADARFTGKPTRYTEGISIEPGAPLDHPRFPVTYEPAA